MKRLSAVLIALASFGLMLYSSSSLVPDADIIVPHVSSPNSLPSPLSFPPSSSHLPSSSSLMLNAPLLVFQSQDGGEISLAEKTEVVAFFFGGTPAEFAAVGLDTTDIDLVQEIKAAGNDTNLAISADRKNATLQNGQTVYYGVKILPAAREKVTGVTFVLTTVPISGIPDIVNNYFKIRYVEAVGGRAGDVKNDSTSGKAYQVITPAGEYLYYFSFTAVVCKGGIRTKIEPHFFGGATVRDVAQDYIQCCCVHTKKPLPRVPEITSCWWYGFPYIGDWFLYWFKVCLAQTAAANTASVPCGVPEATGKDLTITGTGFSRLVPLTPDRIKITDECGSVARVTEIVSATDTEIRAKIDVTACRPGIKTVKIEGAGGFATTSLLKVVQDVPDTIVGQRRFQAVRIIGTQEKLPLTLTINDGTNVTFAADQSFNVTCVTRGGSTTATTTTTGGCNNIATTTIQGTALPGEDTMIVSGNGIRCDAPIRNADITLADGGTICLGRSAQATVTVRFPSTYKNTVTLTAKTTSGTPSVIAVKDAEGNTILSGDGTTPMGTNVTGETWTKGLTIVGLSPGTATLTASYCDGTGIKCVTVTFTIMELLTLTATSSTGKNVTDDDNDPAEPTPILYLCEDANGNGSLTLTATTNPSSSSHVYYQIEGSTATPVAGAVPSGTITLSTSTGNRRFLIHAGLDCNGDGKLNHPTETTRTIEAIVGKMSTLTVIDATDVTHQMTDMTDGGPNPVLTFSGVASADVSLLISALPVDGGILSQARYQVTASNGLLIEDKKYDSEDPFVHLIPMNGITSFTITAGLDCNGDGDLDPEEQERGRTIDILFIMPPSKVIYHVEDPILGDGKRPIDANQTNPTRHEEKDQELIKLWNDKKYYYPLPIEVYANGSGDYLIGIHMIGKSEYIKDTPKAIQDAEAAAMGELTKEVTLLKTIKMQIVAFWNDLGTNVYTEKKYSEQYILTFDGPTLKNENNQREIPELLIPHGLIGKTATIDLKRTTDQGGGTVFVEVDKQNKVVMVHKKLLVRFKKFNVRTKDEKGSPVDFQYFKDGTVQAYVRVVISTENDHAVDTEPFMVFGPQREVVEIGVLKDSMGGKKISHPLSTKLSEPFRYSEMAIPYVNGDGFKDYQDTPFSKHLRVFKKSNVLHLAATAEVPTQGNPVQLVSLVRESEGLIFHLTPRKIKEFRKAFERSREKGAEIDVDTAAGDAFDVKGVKFLDNGYYDTTKFYNGTDIDFYLGEGVSGIRSNTSAKIAMWSDIKENAFWRLVIDLFDFFFGSKLFSITDLIDKMEEVFLDQIGDGVLKKAVEKIYEELNEKLKAKYGENVTKVQAGQFIQSYFKEEIKIATDKGQMLQLYYLLYSAHGFLASKGGLSGTMHRVTMDVEVDTEITMGEFITIYNWGEFEWDQGLDFSNEEEKKDKTPEVKYYNPAFEISINDGGPDEFAHYLIRYRDYRISVLEHLHAYSLQKRGDVPIKATAHMEITDFKVPEGDREKIINGVFIIDGMTPVEGVQQ